MRFPRRAGILLHPTSLPGPHGTGDLGPSALRFADRLAEAGQGLWQVLPLGPTGAANSPYQALSSFAGNPLLISLDALVEDRLLPEKDARRHPDFAEDRADFDGARRFKEEALRTAFERFSEMTASDLHDAFRIFRQETEAWLPDFALFMALKDHFRGKPWYDWPEPGLVRREAKAMKAARAELKKEIRYHVFCQFLFFRQWRHLREHARAKGVHLVGDVPIYAAHDSADVWMAPAFFALDASGRATGQAGVPPDYFSETGQLWGNPLYDWNALEKDGFSWWIERIRATLAQVDILRIDHFRGLESYWAVPAGAATAAEGEWKTGPGSAFFEALETALGEVPIIAEDLGIITEEVEALRARHKLPGMKVLQFAFAEGAESYLPHRFTDPNCVAYTATHDNDTTRGWYAAEGPDYAHMDVEALRRERDKARRYLARDGSDIAWDLIRLVAGSTADTALWPMQDVLDLGNEARMNRPGQAEGQWAWRMTPAQLESFPAERLAELSWLYDRGPSPTTA